ncbi:MAG: NADP-dependent oxidoreductase [Gammaproteobacteria bacterium]
MPEKNRQWLITRRPQGHVTPDDFTYREVDAPDPSDLADGEILIKNLVFLCAPTMRNWMDPPGNSLYPSMPLDAPVMATAAAQIVASKSPDWPVGSRVFTIAGWQDYQVVTPEAAMRLSPLAPGLSCVDGIGRFGLNPLTAYFGLVDVGQPKAGETLVVSGAAGSTGSTVCQIGKIKDMRVVGIAGGPEKCGWLSDECGVDAVIDYKAEDVAERLAALCPDGIDIFYDNVGGEILQAAINNMAPFGRIVLCGQISSYDGGPQPEGPRNMMRLVYGSIRMQGFLCGNYAARFPEGVAALRGWAEEGRLVHRVDLRDGFENLPRAFMSLFDGSNTGTLLVTRIRTPRPSHR